MLISLSIITIVELVATVISTVNWISVAQTIADCYKIIRNGVIAAEPDNSGDILSIYLESGK